MKKTLEKSRCLASLAVFRELYNSEKDVYAIISEFLLELIVSKSKYSFNLTEITSELNIEYDFSIPEAVVRTSLNRIKSLRKDSGCYIVDSLGEIKSPKLNIKKEEIQNSNDHIIKNLICFIEKQDKKTFSETEKSEIINSFISFLIDNTDESNYSKYISTFILENIKDKDFKERLDTIKEGVVLYSGIKFNNNINEIGQWKTNLTIFIETEILFHFAGYNGVLYQTLWSEFFNYVKEINQKHPNRIRLLYFNDVKLEIERFFKKAEYIIDGKDKPNPKVTAMNTIINGCESKADIVSKKALFFQNLKTSKIQEDDFNDYFNEEYYEYNILNQDLIDNLSEKLKIEDVNTYLKFLNYVSIRRKESNENNFENIKYILLSGNSKTLQVAWDDEIKAYGKVPLATTLSFLTNKFWFKLNKGFGGDNFPTTFDIVTKAQIVLSNQINESVGKKYEDFKIEYNKGKLSQEQAKASIIELRRQTKKPEEILGEDLSSILETITEDSLESFLKEQEHFKIEAKKEAIENQKLKTDLHLKENQLKEFEEEKENLNDQLIRTNKNLLLEKEKSITNLKTIKQTIDLEIYKKIRNYKILFISILIISFGFTVFLIEKFDWNLLEQWTWVLGFVTPLFISFVYMLVYEKNLNPLELLKNLKNRIKIKKYTQFNFDTKKLDLLELEKKELITEIQNLKSLHTI